MKQGLTTYKVYQLKSLGALIGTKLPTRKAEPADHINELVFRNLKEILNTLDELGVAALEEAVFNRDGEFRRKQFIVSYQ